MSETPHNTLHPIMAQSMPSEQLCKTYIYNAKSTARTHDMSRDMNEETLLRKIESCAKIKQKMQAQGTWDKNQKKYERLCVQKIDKTLRANAEYMRGQGSFSKCNSIDPQTASIGQVQDCLGDKANYMLTSDYLEQSHVMQHCYEKYQVGDKPKYEVHDFCMIGAKTLDGKPYTVRKDEGWGSNQFKKSKGQAWCQSKCDQTPDCKSYSFTPDHNDWYCYWYADKSLYELRSGDRANCRGLKEYVKVA